MDVITGAKYGYAKLRQSDDRNMGGSTGTSSNAARVTYFDYKNSVDEGSFIPGQYRINPYSVGRCTTEYEYTSEDALHLFVTPVYKDARAGYVYISGYCSTDWVWAQHFARGLARSRRNVESYKQLALQKAYGKLQSADLDLGETLGEYRETIEMLRHPLSSLKKFLVDDHLRNWRLLVALATNNRRKVHKLLGRTGLASLDTMSGTWMELRYGLRPLIMLLEDVIERVNEAKREVIDPEKIRSVTSRLKFTPSASSEIGLCQQGTYYQFSAVSEVKDTITVNASVQYRQTGDQGCLDSFGLSPRFLPETAWALTRCSFVVDWIFSVGPWISTLRVNPDISVLGSTVGCKYEREISFPNQTVRFQFSLRPGWYGTNLKCADKLHVSEYTREVNPELAYYPHFTWGRVLDLWKAIDSAAMIWQAFLSKKK